MAGKLTIAKAMKQVARTKGQIANLTHRMLKCVNTIDSNNFIENYEELATERETQVAVLCELKDKIMKANIKHNMFGTILILSECKNEIDFLRSLEIKQGVVNSRYNETTNTYKTQMSIDTRNKKIDALQERINDITDELDAFNATTTLK